MLYWKRYEFAKNRRFVPQGAVPEEPPPVTTTAAQAGRKPQIHKRESMDSMEQGSSPERTVEPPEGLTIKKRRTI